VIERDVTVDGRTTRFLEAAVSGHPELVEGQPPTLILMHGASPGSNADDWRATLPAFAARGLHTIAYDQPGFAAGEEPDAFPLAYRQRFILAALDTLGIERAILIGHSQSGRLALASALDTPHRVTAAVIMCTGSLLPPLEETPAAADWQRLGEVSPPLMLIYGADDKGHVPERIALARKRYPQLPIHLLEHCGHFAMRDRPESVVELIATFAISAPSSA
jgi:pimeloyl-ACP methyl ester carboxylesterase